MRKEFEMTEEEYKELLNACYPVPYMIIGRHIPKSPQENVNDVWARLGRKLGFLWKTVEPVAGKSNRFFTAEPASGGAA